MRPTLSSGCLSLLSSLLFLSSCRAEILADPSVAQNTKYDFVIVGGGTAGNVIANRLTENPKFNVLLLEAGPSEAGVLDSEIPFLCTHLTPDTPYDWNYTTVAQEGFGGRSIPYPRGHILGGSSSVNYLIYTRGSQDDFDRYAKVSGDQGWSWKQMQQYFKKNERFIPPVDKHNITGQFDPTIHGFTGINSVSLSGFPTPIDGRIINATHQLGGDFTFTPDFNGGNELGVGWMQITVDGPKRSSSATSYLAPQFLQRSNLHVVIGAQVSRVLQTGATKGVPAFRGVEYRLRSGGPLQKVTATKEVVLSAGTVNTPLILLNSGIGDSKALKSAGVKPVVNLVDVGENMSDHAFLGNGWQVNSTNTFDDFNRNATIRAQEINKWETTGTGFLVDTITSHVGFVRMEKDHPIFKTTPDPSAGSTSAHYELLFSNSIPIGTPPPTGHFLGIGTVVTSPSSRGSVKLRSNNPFDSPLIDPALLKSEFDKVAMREAVKSAMKFLTAPAWSDYIIGPVGGVENATTDAALDKYIQANTGTIFHPVGTASMSPKGAKNGVVDPDLTVKLVNGLRVVDASVLPFVPSAHTQAPVYAFAERAADLIKAAYH